LLGKGGQLNLFKKERTSIPIAIYLEEQNFLKWKIMVALRLILTGSLKYRSVYGLDDVLTLYRGTVRGRFSKAWNMFVQLGMTDDGYVMEDSENMSYRQFVNSFLPYHPTDSVEIKTRLILKIDQDDIMWDKLLELDLFNSTKIVGLKMLRLQILEKILSDNWTLEPDDKDMIVMYHKFGYVDGAKKQIDSKMVCIGEDQTYTAMAKTVGLPVAMATC
jgi:saccharopine dehydrogenase-like NADP-dependent oxidoreductase